MDAVLNDISITNPAEVDEEMADITPRAVQKQEKKSKDKKEKKEKKEKSEKSEKKEKKRRHSEVNGEEEVVSEKKKKKKGKSVEA
jgi:nucleolar protein 56